MDDIGFSSEGITKSLKVVKLSRALGKFHPGVINTATE